MRGHAQRRATRALALGTAFDKKKDRPIEKGIVAITAVDQGVFVFENVTVTKLA